LSAPRAGKAMIVNARKQMEMQHSIQQTLEERISLSRAEMEHKDRQVKDNNNNKKKKKKRKSFWGLVGEPTIVVGSKMFLV
jgi:hypothetical protein